MKEIQEHLSRNMKKYRKIHGFTQAMLAERVDCAPNYISLIEQGKKFPSPSMLERIAAAFDVDSSELFVALNQESRIREQMENELLSAIQLSLHRCFSIHIETNLKNRDSWSILP
jgi:transcriptional regulator with XRE-family HTH domain